MTRLVVKKIVNLRHVCKSRDYITQLIYREFIYVFNSKCMTGDDVLCRK